MKVNKYIMFILFLLIISLLAFSVVSQISQTATINIEEKKDCTTTFYDQTEYVWNNVTRARNIYVSCYNSTNQSFSKCVNGTENYQNYEIVGKKAVTKNVSECYTKTFVVSIDKGSSIKKMELDFSEWGVCVQSNENGCIVVTCGTLKGGSARNGIFNGCDGGKACQKFLFCNDGVKVLYKDSTSDFREKEPTFRLRRLGYKEVGE